MLIALPRPGGHLQPSPYLTLSPVVSFCRAKSVTDVKIDFGKVPTSIYNWEVFFHNPLLVATQLSQAQRFEEAQRWFHLIFDPTTNEPGLGARSTLLALSAVPRSRKGDAIDDLLE